MQKLVSPSLLSSDFGNLEKEVKMINDSVADYIHVDVMDGVFVPNITIGFPVIKRIHELAAKPLDVHLMIVEPERYISEFQKAGAGNLTVQYEASTHLHRTIEMIKENGMTAGVALNPHTPVSCLEEIIIDLDMVLIMTVNPGFGGQKFIMNSMDKIRRCHELIMHRNSSALIEVDGGVGVHNAAELYQAGVNVLVAGNAVFNDSDPKEVIRNIKHATG